MAYGKLLSVPDSKIRPAPSQALFYVWQRRQIFMRFQLIPVRYAGPIVCLVIVVAMFKRHADGFLEIDRFLHMER